MISYQARRVAVVNFTGFRPNWGCQATSWGLVDLLNKHLDIEDLPDLSFVPLIPRHVIDRRIEQESLSDIHHAIMEVCQGGQSADRALAYLERLTLERYGKYADQTRSADLVVLQAEGTMAGTDFLRGARLLLLPFVAKHAWKKPVIAMNQTIYSCNDAFTQVMAAAFNSFDLVAVRENISFNAAKSAGIHQVLHIPDAAFLTRARKGGFDVPPGRHFAVTGTAWAGEDTHDDIFAAADRVRQESGLVPLLTVSTAEDLRLLELAKRHWGEDNYAFIPPAASYTAAAYALTRCRFLLSGRYHMAIMALAGGTPVIQLPGNSYKNEGLSALLGGLAPVRQFDELAEIANDAAEILGNAERAAAAVESAVKPIMAHLRSAAIYMAEIQKGQAGEISELLLTMPGTPVCADDHRAHYCANTISQVAGFRYSDADGDGLGRDPIPRDLFGLLLAAYRDGDHGAKNSLIQVLRSYPGKVEGAQPDFRNAIYRLSYEFLAQAGVPRPAGPDEKIYSLGDLHRVCGSNLGTMKTTIVPGKQPAPPRPRAKDLSTHLATLREEFATKPDLLFYHAALICLMRREIDTTEAFACFEALWSGEAEFLLRELDGRWLVSACDTYADHAHDPTVRAVAMTGSVLANVVKLYETERWATGQRGKIPNYRAVTSQAELDDGILAFGIGRGDLLLNLRNRLSATTGIDHIISKIVSELFHRIHRHETVFRRFKNMHHNQITDWDEELRNGSSSPCADSQSGGPHQNAVALNGQARWSYSPLG